MVDSLLENYLPLPAERPHRHLIFTELESFISWRGPVLSAFLRRQPESTIAPYLTALQDRVKAEGVRVGSYPKLHSFVAVSLIGPNESRLHELGKEVKQSWHYSWLETRSSSCTFTGLPGASRESKRARTLNTALGLSLLCTFVTRNKLEYFGDAEIGCCPRKAGLIDTASVRSPTGPVFKALTLALTARPCQP